MLPRVRIGALPHRAGRGRGPVLLHTHPRGLNALARKSIEGAWCAHHSARFQHHHASTRRGDGADFAVAAALVDAHPVHHQLHLTARAYRREHGRGPLQDSGPVEGGSSLRQH